MANEMKKSVFFLRNLLRGLIWLVVILLAFIFTKKNVDPDNVSWITPLYDNPALIYLIFVLSEVILGIIPPEVFFIWALRGNDMLHYIAIIASLSVISYFAGLAGYFIGRYLNTTLYFRILRRKLLARSARLLNIYGLYLIIVAATTPLPFSGVSMLVGSVRYPLKKYLLYSLLRFGRFSLSAWLVWEVNMI